MKIYRVPRWKLSPVIGAVLTIGAGLACHFSDIGRPLDRLSYDLPFALRRNLATDPVVLIYLDEAAAQSLNQPVAAPWDRQIYAQLLHRLIADRARLVCFDIVFSTPSTDRAADEEFAAAMVKHGGVILGGEYLEREQFGTHISVIEKPTPILRKAEAGWGLLLFRPIDPDGAVRQLSLSYNGLPAISAVAAEHCGVPNLLTINRNEPVRWLNYYGPSGEAFASVSIADALRDNGVPPGFFHDRVVFVGGRYATGSLTTTKDEFGNPYSRWGRRFSPGVDIHATAFLNLLRQEWLHRLPHAIEVTILSAIGLLFGAGLCLLRPHWALIVTIMSAVTILTAGCFIVWHRLVWFPFAIPSLIQLPLALGWSVGAQYFVEQRRRAALRRAFSYYLSPEMADRIADSNFDLRPGGSVVETTVLFTDLQNFTTLSEKLPVEDVSQILIAYFTETTKHILEKKGTIIKYIGDAVMATWNAPLEDPRHAQHAIEAAWLLAQASKQTVRGHQLRTRIGIHTGQALAGNLGSPFRFDYTVIGDTTNFASRLEGMNKYLGTQILLSEATASRLDGTLVTRSLGRFLVKGKTIPVTLHELVGPKSLVYGDGGIEPDWLRLFRLGVEAFASGNFESAADLMRQTICSHDGGDSPAEFYLRYMTTADQKPGDGVIRMEEK